MPEAIVEITGPRGSAARPGPDPNPSFDLFISYADDDRTWVEGYLQDALDAAGVKVHSQAAFALGAPRLLEFERAVMRCKRILLVLSPAYMADQFGGFLDIMAQNFGLESGTWPLIPLILKPTPLPPRLSQLVALDATDVDDWQEAVERLCESLNYPIPGPPPLPDCPYPGMLPFSMEQSDRFYGRDQEIEEILQRLRLHPFLMVIGPSGSGKSSLVFAGVIPALHRNASLGAGMWHVHIFRPGSTPRANLRAAPPQTQTRQLLDQAFAEISDSSPGAQAQPATQSPPSPRRLLVIVDQYEELFTTAPTSDAPKDPTDGEEAADPKTTEIALFQQDLLRLAAHPDCYVIATVRADFYADLMASALWPQIQAHRMEVPPMSPANLRQAIMQPAEKLGVYIQSDLVEQLLSDGAGEPGALPLIQETLVLLWQRIQRRYLSLHAYESLVLGRKEYGESGQVSGLQVAMARRADAALAALSAPEQEAARRILLRMIQFGQGRKDTRRQQFSYDLQSENDDPRIFQRTLQHLVDHRLLTLTGEAGAIAKKVDIAHEALISGWPTLGRWIHQRRDGEVVRRRLEQQAQEWQRLGKEGGGLLDEVQLLEAERWMAGPAGKDAGFSTLLQELAQRSRETVNAAALAAEQARQEKVLAAQKLAEEALRREAVEAKAARRMRRLSAVMGVIALITVVLAFRALYLRNQADLARRAADQAQAETLVAYDIAEAARVTNEAHLLASQAVQSMQYDPETAIALAWTALTTDRDTITENTLRRVLLSTYRSTTLEGHTASVRGLAVSPDGTRLVSAGYDGTLRIWSMGSAQTLTILTGGGERLRGVAWSADGRWVAGGGLDGKIYLWDVSAIYSPTLKPDRLLAGHDGWVYALAFSPDGRWLASSGQDGMVSLWNMASGQPFLTVDGGVGEINDVAWSPSGDYLAFAADDQLVGVWPRTDLFALGPGVHTAAAPIRLEGHRSYVLSVDFSPDGAWLASSSADSSVRIWNMQTQASSDMLIDKDGTWIYDVNWSPDGRTLASAAGDNLVRVWDVATGKILRVLTGHKDWVTAAVWVGAKGENQAGGGQTVASASMDGSVSLWQIGVHPSIQIYPAHDSALVAVDWNPAGHWIITAGGGWPFAGLGGNRLLGQHSRLHPGERPAGCGLGTRGGTFRL
ncbi:MAG: TIR domain-containing protein [Caldilineaceae bacterium]|nr:TIR domain-containing protein [Caldilineaceae bacterium]MBP8108457.1 TIR domain-containing protein [Caldilineaceae bacterium]MBP8124609.1 TIR domain-containing protein [Caldilineaceae bacterium]